MHLLQGNTCSVTFSTGPFLLFGPDVLSMRGPVEGLVPENETKPTEAQAARSGAEGGGGCRWALRIAWHNTSKKKHRGEKQLFEHSILRRETTGGGGLGN